MSDIFISYAREDAAVAQTLVSALERSGYDVWWDRQLPTGSRYLDETEAALRSAKATVVLWSKTSVKSHWVADEAGLARDLGRLAPISIDGSMPPLGFGQFHATDFSRWTGDVDEPFTRLLDALKRFDGWGPATASNRREALTPTVTSVPEPEFASIAVLPFVDMSAERDQAYLGDGVAEEILNGLAKVKSLKVSGRTSSFSFRDDNATVEAIGAALHVAHVLEGSVRKQGDRVRITAQLIRVSDGYHVCSESYDGDLRDIFELQDRIARSVVEKLKMLLDVDDGRIISNMTSSPDAYEAFLQGRNLAQRRKLASGRDTEGELASAIKYLEEAVRLDPQFALAWAWLANANFYLPEHNDTPDWQANFIAGRKAAREAIRLAPDLSDANLANSYACLLEFDLLGSWEARRKAHETDPSSVVAVHELGVAYGMMGLHGEAQACADKAVTGDPFSANATASQGLYQWGLGDTKAAGASFKRSVELGNVMAAVPRAMIMSESGDAAALSYFMATMKAHRDQLPPEFQSGLAQWLFGRGIIQNVGWARQVSWLFVKHALGNPKMSPSTALKGALALLGKADAYFDEVRNRPNTHLPGALMQLWLPLPGARALRTHPGFPQFVEDIGLVRCWQKFGWPAQVRPLPGTDGSNLQFTCN